MKITLYMAQTVNGYAAKEDGDAPWSNAVWDTYYKLAREFDSIILGRKSYEIMETVDELGKIGNPFTVVLSRKNMVDRNNVVFVKSVEEAILVLNKKGFKRPFIGGGGEIASAFMKKGLIEKLIIDVEPLVFGKGIKIFADGDFEVKLELLETRKLSKNTIQLWYKVKS